MDQRQSSLDRRSRPVVACDHADRTERSRPVNAKIQQRVSEEGRNEPEGEACNECTRREECPVTVDQPARMTSKSQRIHGTRPTGRATRTSLCVAAFSGRQVGMGNSSCKDMHEQAKLPSASEGGKGPRWASVVCSLTCRRRLPPLQFGDVRQARTCGASIGHTTFRYF